MHLFQMRSMHDKISNLSAERFSEVEARTSMSGISFQGLICNSFSSVLMCIWRNHYFWIFTLMSSQTWQPVGARRSTGDLPICNRLLCSFSQAFGDTAFYRAQKWQRTTSDEHMADGWARRTVKQIGIAYAARSTLRKCARKTEKEIVTKIGQCCHHLSATSEVKSRTGFWRGLFR